MSCDKEALKQILGKTIKAVRVKCDPELSNPMSQLVLVFTDDTSFELYADRPIFTLNGLNPCDQQPTQAYFRAPSGSTEISVEVALEEK